MRLHPALIGALVALVLAVAFWFLLYRPVSEQQALVEDETAQLEEQQSTLRAQIEQLRDIERRQVEINAARARLLEYIPNGPAQPAAIRQLQRTADQAGADIAAVTFGDPAVPDAAAGVAPADTGTPGTTLANIPVTMSVEGGYFQIVDFFRRLEVDVSRAFLVQTVNVQEETDAGFPTLEASWTGQMFAVVSVEDLADTEGGVAPGTPGGGQTAPAPTPTPTPAPGG